MDTQQEMEMKLWDYIDGTAPSNDRSIIDKLLAENSEWRAKYHELMEVHQLIQASELEHPSMRFTKNVMDEISKLHIAPATKSYINKKIIWGIAIFFLTVIVSFLIYGISQIDWSQGSSNNLIGIDFSKVDYSKMFNNTYMNVFMMMNVVLGLMLLDKVLNNKRKRFMAES